MLTKKQKFSDNHGEIFFRNLGQSPSKDIVSFLEHHETVLVEAGKEEEANLKIGD